MSPVTSDEPAKVSFERITGDMDDPVSWVDTLDSKQSECCYSRLTTLLRDIQDEIMKRQCRSDSISCPPFLPIIQSYVNPTRDVRKSSHSRSHSKQKSARAVVSPKSPVQSDVSVVDTSPFVSAASPSIMSPAAASLSPSSVPVVKSEPSTPVPSNDTTSVSAGVTSPDPMSLSGYISVPSSPIYRRVIENMITVAGMGAHTESDLIHCTEQYISKDFAQFNMSWASLRVILRTTCKLLMFLGFLVPFTPDSLSATPFHLPDTISSTNPDTTNTTASNAATSTQAMPSQTESPSNRFMEVANLAREGMISKANWLTERNKAVILSWIGKKGAELQSRSVANGLVANHLKEAVNPSNGQSMLYNYNSNDLPPQLIQLISSPSLSIQQLDQLDLFSQNLLFSYAIHRPPPFMPANPPTDLRSRESTSQQRMNTRNLLGVNRPQIEYVLSGAFWKRQSEAIQQKKELIQLHRKERQLWSQFLGRFGIMLHTQEPKKEPVARDSSSRRSNRNRDRDSASFIHPQLSKPLEGNEGDLHIYSRPIPWSEVIDNFVSLKRSSGKNPSSSSIAGIGSMNQFGSSYMTNHEESKQVFIPNVLPVTRKRPMITREEKEKRVLSPAKRSRIAEENAYYLKINTENLQAMKEHLESIKQKMKEMKEKKKNRKK